MTKKKTVEEVEAAFNQRGFTLLSKDYSSNKSLLNYICSNGHNATIRFDNLQSGHGCSKCSSKSQRNTIEEVRAAFNQRGFTLVSEEYKDAHSSLSYLCSKDHQSKICFSSLQSGHGCSSCTGTKKKTLEEVRELFTARNFTLLSTEYKNCRSLLNYICSNGHNATIRFNNLMSGQGCLDCGGTKKKTIEKVRELFTARGYTLLSTEYKSNNSPLKYLCDQGHQATISFSSLQRGRGCSSCQESGFNPNKPATLYYIRFQFESNLYYKIGITNRTISERFQSEKTAYTVIKETVYPVGKKALSEEQAILKEFARFRYKGKPFLDCGNTELFSRDVLQLDDSILKIKPFQNFAA